jgi:hypothetical protein
MNRRTWLGAVMAALATVPFLPRAQAAKPKLLPAPKKKVWIGHSWPRS